MDCWCLCDRLRCYRAAGMDGVKMKDGLGRLSFMEGLDEASDDLKRAIMKAYFNDDAIEFLRLVHKAQSDWMDVMNKAINSVIV